MSDHPELVTDQLRAMVDESAVADIEKTFAAFQTWMLEKGKNPVKYEGLSSGTVSNYIDRMDHLLRRNIELHDPADPTCLTQDQADQLIDSFNEDRIRKQNGDPYSSDAKRKFSNAMEKYFLWQAKTMDKEQWQPNIEFSQSSYDSPDHFSFEERHRIRESALEYGSLPSYYSVSDEERDRIKGLIAQRLGKPKAEITVKDWKRADKSSKVGSLILMGLDTGLSPKEVGKAKLHWVDLSRNLIVIPEKHALKERETNEIPFDDDTATALSEWFQERRQYEKYDHTELIWLNQDGNPYNSHNLCDLIRNVCEEAGIDHEDRKIVWYSVRHNLGETLEEIGGLDEASDQLRHKSLETTNDPYGGTHPQARANSLKKLNEAAKRAAEDPLFDPYHDEVDFESVPEGGALSDQKPRYPDEADNRSARSGSDGTVHIDNRIPDTPEARNELATDILQGTDGDAD